MAQSIGLLVLDGGVLTENIQYPRLDQKLLDTAPAEKFKSKFWRHKIGHTLEVLMHTELLEQTCSDGN